MNKPKGKHAPGRHRKPAKTLTQTIKKLLATKPTYDPNADTILLPKIQTQQIH